MMQAAGATGSGRAGELRREMADGLIVMSMPLRF